MRDTEAALKWIVEILNKHKIPFQIAGGFAAIIYGSLRELADIDIDVPKYCYDKILHEVKDYIVFPPQKYKDENWNLELMTLKFKGQNIDISSEAKIFDKRENQWVDLKTDFSNSDYMEIYNITVPVIRKKDLIEYKNKLLREVDKKDVEALTNRKY